MDKYILKSDVMKIINDHFPVYNGDDDDVTNTLGAAMCSIRGFVDELKEVALKSDCCEDSDLQEDRVNGEEILQLLENDNHCDESNTSYWTEVEVELVDLKEDIESGLIYTKNSNLYFYEDQYEDEYGHNEIDEMMSDFIKRANKILPKGLEMLRGGYSAFIRKVED